MSKTAIVTGITGQTGSYLAELLLGAEYKVYGLRRRTSTFTTERIDHVYRDPHISDRLELVYGDLGDQASVATLVGDVKPDLFFNLGAQSHVRVSFEIPEYTVDTNATGVFRCLESIRRFSPKTRFLQASTSEMWGNSPAPQDEKTPFCPRSPYGAATLAAFWGTVTHREAYKLFAVNSISANHESPRRGETFVTRKITRAVGRIFHGRQHELFLGNLEAKRDWSHARDVAKGMLKAILHTEPDDFVFASGKAKTVRDFAEKAFAHVDLDYKDFVEIDPRYLRPTEVDHLEGNSAKAREVLGWAPEVDFDQLVTEMVDHDMHKAAQEVRLALFQRGRNANP